MDKITCPNCKAIITNEGELFHSPEMVDIDSLRARITELETENISLKSNQALNDSPNQSRKSTLDDIFN